jgi:hypothetical protein
MIWRAVLAPSARLLRMSERSRGVTTPSWTACVASSRSSSAVTRWPSMSSTLPSPRGRVTALAIAFITHTSGRSAVWMAPIGTAVSAAAPSA